MIVECIFVGTELLLGEILNTNAQFLSQRLAELSVDCYHQVTVGDNAGRLAAALQRALTRSDVVITTGGLGPTLDDLTKETVATVFGRDLVLHEPSWAQIEAYFRSRGREPGDSNRKQAFFPPDAHVLANAYGTAPGMILEEGGKAVVVLPGPPRELQPLFMEQVEPWLKARLGPGHPQFFTRVLHFAGIGEADLHTRLEDLFVHQTDVFLAPYAKLGEVHVRLSTKAASAADAAPHLDRAEQVIRSRIGSYIYGLDDATLAGVIGSLCRKRGWDIAVAESCTGGLLAKRLTDEPGSSDYFDRGVVTYSNGSKTDLLGVPAELLMTAGAVSEAAAGAMAEGVRQRAGTALGVGITGVAGPGGGSETKPVGTVFIAVASPAGTEVKRYLLRSDNRDTVRQLAAQEALRRIWVTLKEGVEEQP